MEGDSLTEKEAESLMADVDKNKDGVISYKEFVKMLTDDDTGFNDNKKSYFGHQRLTALLHVAHYQLLAARQ